MSGLVRIARRLPLARRAFELLTVLKPTAASLTRKNTVEAYDAVYGSDRILNEYLSPERLEFYEEVATTVAPLEPRRVIDVGCGTGDLLRFLVDHMPVRPERVVGVDHSEAGIARARMLLPSGTWLVDDIYRFAVDEEFDLVLCTEVLEHLHEPEEAVSVLCRLCAPGGRVAITVPDGAQDSWEGHVNFWTEEDLRAFLEPHGLTAIDRLQDGDVLFAWLAPRG